MGAVGLRSVGLTHEELEAVLGHILETVRHRDSFGGSIEFDALAEVPEGKDFLVRATYRVGNSEGQGGVRVIGTFREGGE